MSLAGSILRVKLLFLHYGILITMVSSLATSSSPVNNSKTTNNNNCEYIIRKFDTAKDLDALHDICRNVYGGSDYLPKTAPILASDPNSCFYVMADDETDRPAAVGNARKFKPRMSWLEAIRTCEEHRGRGLARRLTQSLIDLSRSEHGSEVYSCTVASNVAMQRVFDRVGMMKLGQIHQCSFAELQKLPGWAAGGDDHDDDDDNATPLPLLQSLGIEEQTCDMESTSISSQEELNETLTQIKAKGGIGHLVGLYELLPDDAVNDSLKSGRMWKLACNSKEDVAVVAVAREEKISSLKSPWVCSISATSIEALEAALWHACSNQSLKTLEGHVAFTVAFDVCGIPLDTEGSISPTVKTLPLTDDACLLFGSSTDL